MKEKFKIFNSTSEEMSEISDKSVDIVIFSPPYNINTSYDKNSDDKKTFDQYKLMIVKVMHECQRVLKSNGIMLIEAADTVYCQKKFISLSDLIQKIALESKLHLKERHINFLQSKNGVVVQDNGHDWTDDYYSKEESHSNCHQWLIFTKNKVKFNSSTGYIFYVNYPSNEDGHPCPFSYEHVNIFLKLTNFKKGMAVLDPFMGTARLGEGVIKKGGKYIGFEISRKHFLTAKKRLEKLIK